MKEKVSIRLVLLVIAVLVTTILGLYFKPKYVKLELVKSVQNANINVNDGKSDFSLELHWWFIESYPSLENSLQLGTVSPDISSHLISSNPENMKIWGINFDELGIDFDKNNVILAFSRKIKKMKFKRADWLPYRTISTVKTIMSKEFEQHTIYVYKIPKEDVREDLRAYTETTVEK